MAPTPSDSYRGVTVLVVEDEPHTRTLIKSLLHQIGVASVVEAGNGEEGLEEALRTRPTVILCDVHMQPVDGRKFLKTLRALKVRSLAVTPVIFLTADAQADTVLFAKEHRVNGYLVKPISLTELKTRIDAVLKGTAPG
ncbi:MAG: response regulator [Alphaproteobacteria bacterium]|nr:response regulator [Alphaproteobacteria bacterium]